MCTIIIALLGLSRSAWVVVSEALGRPRITPFIAIEVGSVITMERHARNRQHSCEIIEHSRLVMYYPSVDSHSPIV